jgi:hypothetical protein
LFGCSRSREEAVHDAVGEDTDPRRGYREVPVELGGVALVEVGTTVLALHQDDRLAVLQDRVIDLLALFDPDVGVQLGCNLGRVEDVVAESADEGQNEGGLGRLLGLDVVLLARDPGRERREFVREVHCSPPRFQ